MTEVVAVATSSPPRKPARKRRVKKRSDDFYARLDRPLRETIRAPQKGVSESLRASRGGVS